MALPSLNSARVAALFVPFLIGTFLLVTSTVSLTLDYWLYDIKRILQLSILPIIFAVCLANAELRANFEKQLTRWPQLLWLLAIVFTLAICSALLSANSVMHLAYSAAGVIQPALIVLAIPAVAACREAAGQYFDRLALGLLALAMAAVGLQEATGVLASWEMGTEFSFQIALMHFSWPRFFNQVQVWIIPALAALPLLFPGRRLVLIACALVLALQWYLIVMTGARGAALSLVFALALSIVCFRSSRRALLLWQGLGMLGGGMLYAMVLLSYAPSTDQDRSAMTSAVSQSPSESAEGPAQADQSNSKKSRGRFHELALGRPMANSSGQLALWQDSIDDAIHHPWFGIGPMNYACKGKITRPGHPHSLPLQIAGEWGIPAALGLLALALFFAWFVLRAVTHSARLSNRKPNISAFLATGVAAAGMYSCLSAVHMTPASQTVAVLMMGWLLGSLPTTRLHSSGVVGGRLLVSSLTVALVLLLASAVELRRLEFRTQQMAPIDTLYPRYWQDGKVCSLFTAP